MARMPQRNRTTSEPSRSTASPTTAASAVIGRLPALTAAPSPASSTSRKTMTAAPSMGLLRDHLALGGIGVELADELVAAGLERSDPDEALRFARDDLLDLERGAVELFGRGILVAHVDRHAL